MFIHRNNWMGYLLTVVRFYTNARFLLFLNFCLWFVFEIYLLKNKNEISSQEKFHSNFQFVYVCA